jgi:hypothetical protein
MMRGIPIGYDDGVGKPCGLMISGVEPPTVVAFVNSAPNHANAPALTKLHCFLAHLIFVPG